MDRIKWIKDLVLAEQEMEETGIIDLSAGDQENRLSLDTLDFLQDLKAAFVESAAAFNQLKGSTLGTVKIYGIAKTQADFMLFRNGFKLIFSMLRPGEINVYYNHMGSHALPQPDAEDSPAAPSRDVLKATWGAFGDLNWTYNDQPIKIDYMTRHYMTRFIRESAK